MKAGYSGYLVGIALGLVGCAGNVTSCETGAQNTQDTLLNAWEENNFQDRNAAWTVQPDATPCTMNDDAKKAVRDAHGAGGADRVSTYERLCAQGQGDCVEG